MSEFHRLKPMVENYDPKLFNELYAKTKGLRRKLASEIQASKLGVDYDEILSEFDVKFIFVFNKYCNEQPPNILLGNLINALKNYKNRILRQSYAKKNSVTVNTTHVEELQDFENVFVDKTPTHKDGNDLWLNRALIFLKDNLSKDAYRLLELELFPPEYITYRLPEKSRKVPNELIMEYMGLADEAEEYIYELRFQIKEGIKRAKSYFTTYQLT